MTVSLQPDEKKSYLQIGLIVGQVNSVEAFINQIIADYYIEHGTDKNLEFSSNLLQSGAVSLDNKMKLLSMISRAKNKPFSRQVESDIKQWRLLRNIVAHGLPMHHIDTDKVSMLFNNEFHDLDKLRKSFASRQDRIMDKLRNLMQP